MKIRTKLLMLLVLGAVVPLALSHFFSVRMTVGAMRKLVSRSMVASAELAAGRVQERVHSALRELSNAAESVPFESFSGDELARALEIPYRQISAATAVALLDERGDALAPPFRLAGDEARLLERESVTAADLERFASHVPLELALSANVALGPVYRSASGRPRMVAATAFPALGREQRWVLAVELALDELCEMIAALEQPGRQRAALVDIRGKRACLAAESEEGRGAFGGADLPKLETGVAVRRARADGKPVLDAVVEIPVTAWRLALERPEELVMEPIDRTLTWTALWAGVALLIAIAGGVVLARGLTGPIAELERAARRVADGEYDQDLEVRGRDEVGKLSAAFNKMTAEIRAWNAELIERVEDRTRALREAQDQVVQGQKLAAIGELGAGVAHEINNPLTGVIGTAQLLRPELEQGSDQEEMCRAIIADARRVAEVVDGLLRYSQTRVDAEMQSVDAAEILDGAAEGFAARIEERGVEVAKSFEGDCRINAVASELELACRHLIDNALRAMPAGGRMRLEIHRVEGGAIELSVVDDGVGMDDETRERARDAFFTSEPPGSGHQGVGLALVQRVVAEHEGRLVLESAPGEGTRVSMYFPGATTISKS